MANLTLYGNGRLGMPTLLGWGWDPMKLFDDLFDTFKGETVWNISPVTLEHESDHVLVTADMPGVDPDDVEVTFDAGTLAIAGQRGKRRYRYAVTLGDEIDPDQIEAELDKGVLTVKAYKRPEARPRKIALKTRAPKTLASGEAA